MDATGITFDEKVAFRRYDWVAMARFLETHRLLLPCPTDASCEIIPKRAFASPQELEAARALLQSQIRDRDAAPPAFPVIGAAPVTR